MEQSASTRGTGLQYGIIAAAIMIIYSLIIQFAGLALESWVSWVSYLILAVAIYLAHNKFKENGDGFMTYGQGLALGFWVSLAAGVISSIFSFVYISFVDDSLIQQIKEKSRYDMEERGMSDAEIDMAMEMTEKFVSPGMMLVWGIVGTLLIGFLLSLIVSAITKKNNPQLEV